MLGVADKFVQQVRRSKIVAHRGEKFEFLIDAISSPDFDPQKEYTIGELLELADTTGQSVSNIAKSLNSEGVRDAIATLALSLGYVLRFEKKRLKGRINPKSGLFSRRYRLRGVRGCGGYCVNVVLILIVATREVFCQITILC